MKVAPQVAELRELLGHDVLLLSWPWGKKGDKRRWKHLTADAMKEPAYLRKLGTGNIGVALGQVSGGLCSLDIDSDDEMEHLLSLNPDIGRTLLSRGSRGGNLWWRMRGPYPGLKVLERHGKKWGEWRSTGSQTIIHGRHPNGNDYQIVNRVKPITIELIQIQWPEGIYPLLQGAGMPIVPKEPSEFISFHNRTDESDELHASEAIEARDAKDETDEKEEITASGFVVTSLPDDLLFKYIPHEVHQNHNLLFELAREVRTFEDQQGGRYMPLQLREVFDRWYAKAKPFLRVEQSEDDYFMEFMKAYQKVKVLLGEDVFRQAMLRARKSEPVKEVRDLVKDPQIRLLGSLCRELQRQWGSAPFFLSCRMVEKEFGICTSTAARWLNGLEGCKIIQTVTKGDAKTMKASRFRYLCAL